MENLLARAPDEPRWIDDLARSENQIGDVLLSLGKPSDALRSFQEAAQSLDQLIASHPHNLEWRLDRASVEVNLGRVSAALGRPEKALRILREAEAGVREGAASDPAGSRRAAIRIARHQIDAYFAMKDLTAARLVCDERGTRAAGIPVAEDASFSLQTELVRLDLACAELAAREGDRGGAAKSFAEAARRLRELSHTSPTDVTLRADRERAEQKLAELAAAR